MKFILIYLVIINAGAFLLMLLDKYKAIKKLWRIPEVTLIAAAILGGSLGSLLGMYAVRHKTKHTKFAVGIPLILIAQVIISYLYLTTK